MSIYHLIYYFILQCIYTLALLFSSIHIHSFFIVFVVGSLLSWFGISHVGFNTYTFAVWLLIRLLGKIEGNLLFCRGECKGGYYDDGVALVWFGSLVV